MAYKQKINPRTGKFDMVGNPDGPGGSVQPDEEDITLNSEDKLQFKNRAASETQMGYVILRKDKTFAEQVTQANTIYEIRYGFDLGGATVTIPEGCTLKFEGGKVSGGTLTGNKTMIEYNSVCFGNDIQFSGNWNVKTIHSYIIENPTENNAICKLVDLTSDSIFNEIIIAPASYTLVAPANESTLISLKSNTDFINSGEIKIAPNGYPRYNIIAAISKVKTHIIGGIYIGDVDEHDYSSGGTHEWGHCLKLKDCTDSSINDTTCKNAAGDGIVISGTNISVTNVNITHCGRQGITVLEGSNYLISKFKITDIFRVSPKSAIDVEPMYGTVKNIKITDGYFEGYFVCSNTINLEISVAYFTNTSRCIIIGRDTYNVLVKNVSCIDLPYLSRAGAIYIESELKSVQFDNLRITSSDGSSYPGNAFAIYSPDGSERIMVRNSYFSPQSIGYIKNMQFENCVIKPLNNSSLPFHLSKPENQNVRFDNCELNGMFTISGDNVEVYNSILSYSHTASKNYVIYSNAAFTGDRECTFYNCTFINNGQLNHAFVCPYKTFTFIGCSFVTDQQIPALFSEEHTPVNIYLDGNKYSISDYSQHLTKSLKNDFTITEDGFLLSELCKVSNLTMTEPLTGSTFVNSSKFIVKDVDLDSKSIRLPSGCEFEIISISNGTIDINGSKIIPYYNKLSNVTVVGSPAIGTQKIEDDGSVSFWNGAEWVVETDINGCGKLGMLSFTSSGKKVHSPSIHSDVTQIEYKYKKKYYPLKNKVGQVIDIDSPTASGSGFNCTWFECNEGDELWINATGGEDARLWGFLNSDKVLLSIAESKTTLNNELVRIPKDTAYCLINSNADNGSYFVKYSVVASDFDLSFLTKIENINIYSYPKRSGSSEERPNLTAKSKGFLYFDESLSKILVWNGTAWVESTTVTPTITTGTQIATINGVDIFAPAATKETVVIKNINGVITKVSGPEKYSLLEVEGIYEGKNIKYPDNAHYHIIIDGFENKEELYQKFMMEHKISIRYSAIRSDGITRQWLDSYILQNHAYLKIGQLQTGTDEQGDPTYLYFLWAELDGSVVQNNAVLYWEFEKIVEWS